jgi:hypothetical protein
MTISQWMRFWGRWMAWLCLSLMLWMVAAESTHNHPNQTEANSCSICLVAHSASPAPSSSDATPVFTAVGFLQEEEVLAKAQFDFSDAGIRGPPSL